MDEKRARTVLTLGFKGKKRKDEVGTNPLEMAEACKFHLKQGYSLEEIANKYSVSERLVGKFISLLRLPSEVRTQLSKGTIGIDVASQLAEARLTEETKIKVGNVIAGLSAHDARGIIQYAKKFPNASFGEYRQRVLNSKPKKEEISLIVISLQEEGYRKLKEQADKQKTSIHDLGQRIINEWLEKRS